MNKDIFSRKYRKYLPQVYVIMRPGNLNDETFSSSSILTNTLSLTYFSFEITLPRNKPGVDFGCFRFQGRNSIFFNNEIYFYSDM